MRLLRINTVPATTVLLFGVGLIGGATDRALRRRWNCEVTDLPYDWHDTVRRGSQRQHILAALPPSERIEFVWAGGRGGFDSNDAEMRTETAMVEELIDLAGTLRDHTDVVFHLISSAGGLFEGQTHCHAGSRPAPRRGYGRGKLEQEVCLIKSGLDRHHIYRPSSVYGVTDSKRVGLISVLILNAMAGRVTKIFGSRHTLRDYVLSDDVGRYIAGCIARPDAPPSGVHCLANGRSASVGEIIERVREQVARPVFLQFDPRPSNALNMSFLPSGLPSDWTPTSLANGITQVGHFLRSRFIL